MKLPNKPKVLAATINPVSNTKMISLLVDFPTVLLAELRTHRILTQGSLYEHMEHDMFNMSANSARAIPHSRYVKNIIENPFIPIWTKQQKGMSGEAFSNEESDVVNQMWIDYLKGCDSKMAIEVNSNTTIAKVFTEVTEESHGWIVDYHKKGITDFHQYLIDRGVHKQNANRILAPFAWTTCIITGTEWENFFELRCPMYYDAKSKQIFKSRKAYCKYIEAETGIYPVHSEDFWQAINKSPAQPEFQVIAEMLYDLCAEADWRINKYHIPFEREILKQYSSHFKWDTGVMHIMSCKDENGVKCGMCQQSDEINRKLQEDLILISASMCAKLSYNTQDNEDTVEKHLERAKMLLEHRHMEPFSHQAVAMDKMEYYNDFYKSMVKNIDGKKVAVRELGWCYNLRGFISKRYMIENY